MKKALIIGAAISGTAAAKLLNHHGYDVTLIDQNLIPNKCELTAVGIHIFEKDNSIELANVPWDLVVKNPGITQHHPLVVALQATNFIYTEIEVASWFAPHFTYGAITGTNGKTTTTTILYEMLKRQYDDALVAGNIGTALSELIDGHENDTAHVALEISAFQLLGCDRFKPKAAVIINLTPDHLDVFEHVEDYYDAKVRITEHMDASDLFLRNIDDPEVVKRTQNLHCQVVNFSLVEETDAYLRDGVVYYLGNKLFSTDELTIVGRHNIQNAMIAAVMAIHLGVSRENIHSALQNFKGVEHRIEYIRTLDGVSYYNDSKATNPEATEVALKAFDLSRVILLAGGYDKHTGFKILQPYFKELKALIVFGETKDMFKQLDSEAIVVQSMQQALDVATRMANDGDVVLLSPACSSYDQFDNYEQRGEIFKDSVEKL